MRYISARFIRGDKKLHNTDREKYALLYGVWSEAMTAGMDPHERGSYAAVKDRWENGDRTDTGSGVGIRLLRQWSLCFGMF